MSAIPRFVAPLEHPTAKRVIVERAQRDLDGCDGGERDGLVELSAVHVRDADALHEPVVDESGERAHRRAPRRARIGRVQQVEIDREPVERDEARLAVGPDRLRATVRHPAAAGSRHSALRHDPRASPPRRRRAKLARAAARCGRDRRRHGRTRARCRTPSRLPRRRGDGREGALLVPLGVRRQAHAAEADTQLRRVRPSGGTQEKEGTRGTGTWRSAASERGVLRAGGGTAHVPAVARCGRDAGIAHVPCCGRVESERRAVSGLRPLVRFALEWKAWASISRFSSRR